MRLWGCERASGLRFGRASATLAAVGAAAGVFVAAGQGAPLLRAATHGGSSRPAITPRGGQPFRPTLGDWEGTVDGFPASFGLRYAADSSGRPRYGFNNVVALRPSGCPANASPYVEDVIASPRLIATARFGALGLAQAGFGGNLLGASSATLSRHYQTPTCSGTLSWHMHPAQRRPVHDGLWKASWSSGGSATFHVIAGGRLATGITVPGRVTACDGVTGQVDLFLAASGRAGLSEHGLNASLSFTGSAGSGQIDAGGRGCAGGPVRLRLSLLKPTS
jgi:hypothetical protein